MLHGRRFWKKHFKSSPERDANLMRIMLTQLFGHERVKTTVPKAKWLQHRADEIIAWAKANTPETRERIAQSVNNHERTMPKITGLLAHRYRDTSGRFTRIVRAGHNPSGSDRAPLAYVELVYNPGDIRFTQAAYHMDPTVRRLNEVRNCLYITREHKLIDPTTGETAEVKQHFLNPALPKMTSLKLRNKEWFILKDLNRMHKATDLYQKARRSDRQFYLAMKKHRIEKYTPILKEKQLMVHSDVALHGVVLKATRRAVEEDGLYRIDDKFKVHHVLTPTEKILEGLDVVNPLNAPKNTPGKGDLTEKDKKQVIHKFFVQLACLQYRNRVKKFKLNTK